jgi:hypothetical protein
MQTKDYYDFLQFNSLSKTKSFPFQEWIGQVDEDERTIIINYRNGDLTIGIDSREMNCRTNMVSLGCSQVHDVNMNIDKITKSLELTWVLPSGYVEGI